MKFILTLGAATLATANAAIYGDRVAPRQTDCSATSAIPTCGVPCITSAAVAIGCATTDYDCQCTSSAELQSSAEACVLSACGAVTGLEVVSAAQAVCTACA